MMDWRRRLPAVTAGRDAAQPRRPIVRSAHARVPGGSPDLFTKRGSVTGRVTANRDPPKSPPSRGAVGRRSHPRRAGQGWRARRARAGERGAYQTGRVGAACGASRESADRSGCDRSIRVKWRLSVSRSGASTVAGSLGSKMACVRPAARPGLGPVRRPAVKLGLRIGRHGAGV